MFRLSLTIRPKQVGDKIVVLSFTYTGCSVVNGCPLATFVMKGCRTGCARIHT